MLEGVFEPVVGVDAEVLAADNEGVEDSIVLCAAVVLAEEVVFAPSTVERCPCSTGLLSMW